MAESEHDFKPKPPISRGASTGSAVGNTPGPGAVAYDMRAYTARMAELEQRIALMPLMHLPEAPLAAVPAQVRSARGPVSSAYPLSWITPEQQLPLKVITRSSADDHGSLGKERRAQAPSWAHAAPPRQAGAAPTTPRGTARSVGAAPQPLSAPVQTDDEANAQQAASDSDSGADEAEGEAQPSTPRPPLPEPEAALAPPLASSASGSLAAGSGAAELLQDLPPGERALFAAQLQPGQEVPVLDESGRVLDPRGHPLLRACDLVLEIDGEAVNPPHPSADVSPNAMLASAAASRQRQPRAKTATATDAQASPEAAAAASVAVELRVLRSSKWAALAPEPAAGSGDERVRICCVTWNLHGKQPPESLAALLHRGRTRYDLYAIGSQEAERSIEASLINSSKARWEATLTGTLGSDYTLVGSHVLAAMHIAVFATAELAARISGVRTAHVATGVANTLGNKGGVGVSFQLGLTSFCFVSCHLSAHQGAVAQRNADFRRVDELLDLSPPPGPARERVSRAGRSSVSARFDRVFWMGDFNYRVNGNRAIVDKLLAARSEAEARQAGWASADECARESLRVLLRNDQLHLQMSRALVFRGFVEGEIGFRPTYKFDSRKKEAYDLSEKRRIPAWTDRVLFVDSVRSPGAIALHAYTSVESISSSDHKPVLADLSVRLEHEREPPASAPQLVRSYTRGGGGRALADAPPPPPPPGSGSSTTCVIS